MLLGQPATDMMESNGSRRNGEQPRTAARAPPGRVAEKTSVGPCGQPQRGEVLQAA